MSQRRKRIRPVPPRPIVSERRRHWGRRFMWLAVAVVLLGSSVILLVHDGSGMPEFALLGAVAIPDPDLAGMEPRVSQRIRDARAAVFGQPSSAEAWGRLGQVTDIHELYACATICYRRALSLNGQDFRWPYMLAIVLERQGRDADQVVSLMRAAIRLQPDYAPAHVRLGDTFARAGRLSEASEAYQTAIGLDGALGLAHRGLGQVLLRLNEVEAASRELEQAVELTPADAAAFTALAQAYMRMGDRQRAAEAAAASRGKQAVHALSDPVWLEVVAAGISSSICVERGKRFLQQSQFGPAIREYKIAEEVMPDNPYIQRSLGVAYMNTGQWDTAITYLSKAVSLKQDFVGARITLGKLLLNQNRLDEAITQLRWAVEAAPDKGDVHASLATALAKRGNLDDAIAEFESAAALSQLDAKALTNWGTALAQRRQISQAVVRFGQALQLDPDNPTIHYNLALSLESVGRLDQAIEHYSRAVEVNPIHPASRRLALLESRLRARDRQTPDNR